MKIQNDEIKIAVLLTCHNRRELTEVCIRSAVRAKEKYNSNASSCIELHFFLTDDACTDNTAKVAIKAAGENKISIVKADGNAFWAGGMRLSWKKAIETDKFDFFLLLNDDTEVWDNLFSELFACHKYALNSFGKGGIYSGNTSWFEDKSKITFGGKVAGPGFFSRFYRLIPNGEPQKCDIVNANILMVSSNVVDNIGIFPQCYIHGAADNDYGMRANHAGLPVLITPGFCGSCDADNYNYYEETEKLNKMSIAERINYLRFPVRSIRDTLAFSIRWRKRIIPLVLIMRIIQIVSPMLYYRLFNYKRQ